MNTINTKDEIYFNFSYFALRLLGKGLYSNAWTAIAELVANGFDANAQHVKIYINASNKEKSVIEIFDDGYGMGYDDLVSKYTLIGRDKRDDKTIDEETKKQLMGRKGIGKLAALYLSKKYYLISKTKKESSAWCLDSLDAKDSDVPRLDRIDAKKINIESGPFWEKNKTGTMIKLTDVDLRNFGVQSLKGLQARLADFFLTDALDGKMEVAFLTHRGEKINFEKVEKEIAFKNMYALFNNTPRNIEKELCQSLFFKSSIKQIANKKRHTIFFDRKKFPETSGEQCFLLSDGRKTKKGLPYKLEGWIGIHATIDKESASSNDSRYLKNKVYNPNKLRLYVRKKLAVENFLDYLHNTQAFSNYIEGEISFDILDNDKLPDIATTNRQGFDEDSDRIQLLIDILKPIVSALIKRRVDIGEEIKQEEKDYKKEQERIANEKAEVERQKAERAERDREKAERDRDKAYEDRKKQEARADAAEADLHSERKRNSFLTENISVEKKDFVEKFHLVKINLDSIKNKIGSLIIRKEKNRLDFDGVWETVKFISLTVARMKAVFSYGMKANFNTEDENIKANLFEFIEDYCANVLKKMHDDLNIAVSIEKSETYECEFSPQDIGAIFENIASNSEKFNARNLFVNMNFSKKDLLIDIIDDGKGVDKTKIKNINSLFDFGKGFTSSGSGVGLYHVKTIVNEKFHGNISINEERTKGFELNIRIPK
ncbi:MULTISPECIES: ATP-binding protein [unclassified Fibrobacter]|uniref:ATP-binding protein n=1 Tax=unclassified Fibrobacter TaxID=2634177 RepID=UPI0025BFFCA4|nr:MULTISPECIES: ATP-binding protein [unclassified Fibrobacter]